MISMFGIQRFHQQIQSFTHQVPCSIEDIDSATIFIQGPKGSPYESGVFQILLTNLEAFPKHPPIVFFQTRIWHPLVELETGRVCPTLLNEHWSPFEGLEGFLNRLQTFFFRQTADFCINTEAAKQVALGTFETHAQLFTKKYACNY